MTNNQPCREIPLTKGKFAIVDPEDYIILSEFKWYVISSGYAMRQIQNKALKAHYLMHRVIMNCPSDMQIDHINGDRLDNRKSNLRLCTKAENARARRKTWKSSSVYKGVKKVGKRWRACIYIKQKYSHLGMFDIEKDAAIAYNNAALEHYGQFAVLNILEESHG